MKTLGGIKSIPFYSALKGPNPKCNHVHYVSSNFALTTQIARVVLMRESCGDNSREDAQVGNLIFCKRLLDE